MSVILNPLSQQYTEYTGSSVKNDNRDNRRYASPSRNGRTSTIFPTTSRKVESMLVKIKSIASSPEQTSFQHSDSVHPTVEQLNQVINSDLNSLDVKNSGYLDFLLDTTAYMNGIKEIFAEVINNTTDTKFGADYRTQLGQLLTGLTAAQSHGYVPVANFSSNQHSF